MRDCCRWGIDYSSASLVSNYHLVNPHTQLTKLRMLSQRTEQLG